MAVILCFNPDEKTLGKARVVALRCRTPLRIVPREDFTKPLNALLSGEPAEAQPDEPFDGQMLVLCDMDDQRARQFLDGLRAAKACPGAYKAVLTQTNAHWSACRLFRELRAERDALSRGQKAHGDDA